MITPEKIEIVNEYKKTVNVWRNDFTSKEYNFISELNYIATGKHLNRMQNCDCVIDFFNIILPLYIKKNKDMSKFFKLRESVVSYETMKYGTISAGTPDDIHAELLTEFPNLEKHYSLANVEEFKASKKEKVAEEKVAEKPARKEKTVKKEKIEEPVKEDPVKENIDETNIDEDETFSDEFEELN